MLVLFVHKSAVLFSASSDETPVPPEGTTVQIDGTTFRVAHLIWRPKEGRIHVHIRHSENQIEGN